MPGVRTGWRTGKGLIATREYRIGLDQYGISKWAYEELRAFCRQYPEKKRKADELLGIRSHDHTEQSGDGRAALPRGGGVGDPTASAAIQRERYMRDIDLIDSAAAETEGGRWARALIKSACYGIPYDQISKAIMPTSNRNAFFRARREFFYRLDRKKNGGPTCD